MNPTLIYFWGIADRVSDFLKITTIASFAVLGFGLFVCLMASSFEGLDTFKTIMSTVGKWFKRVAWTGGITGLLFVATPSSNTIAMMYVLPEIANSDVVKKDLPEVYEAAKKALLHKLDVPAEKP